MKIATYPDPVLLQRARPVGSVDVETRERVSEMFQLMYEARGIGLAAPQVGWSVRLFIVNLAASRGEGEERVFLNPRIVEKKGSNLAEEGCLSLPGVTGMVPRATWVRLSAQDLDGQPVELEAENLFARVLQHESDHLDGILFTSKVPPSQQKQVLKKLRELRESALAGQA